MPITPLTSHINRRTALVAAASVLATGLGHAQTAPYPNKLIKVMVPFPPGTSPDVVARMWADSLRQATGQTVIIDNRAGASTMIGTQAALAAPADGYTVLYTVANTFSINPFIFPTVAYKAEDFVPVNKLLTVPHLMIAPPNAPFNTVPELVRYAKANPGVVSYASYGVGSAGHIAMVQFAEALGLKLNHVPYKDGGLNDLAAGHVGLSLEPTTNAVSWAKSGRVKALGITTTQRSPLLPNVPSLHDTLPGILGNSWHGIFVRAGTPQPFVDALAALSQKIVADPAFREKISQLGLPPAPANGTRKDFEDFLKVDARDYRKAVVDNNIRVE
ncbi:MAG: tripartite tricarboxylate transporter substrate binding protein [Polaromonas sp.]|nr:tripartite tricarboxylate transporter substrate binding protein [Polaromonas sp.]